MAISPQESRNSDQVKTNADALEKMIDERLLMGYDEITFHADGNVITLAKLTEGVQEEVRQRYIDAGWSDVKFNLIFNSEEGAFYSLHIKFVKPEQKL